MKTNTKHYLNMFFFILVIFLTASIISGCGKDNQKIFEKGMTAYNAQDYKTAVEQFTIAANNGHVEAQYWIAECYSHGNGVEKDYKEAFKWQFKAAEQGYPDAQVKIGHFYSTEFLSQKAGIKTDRKEAEMWYRKAIEQRNTAPEAAEAAEVALNSMKNSYGF